MIFVFLDFLSTKLYNIYCVVSGFFQHIFEIHSYCCMYCISSLFIHVHSCMDILPPSHPSTYLRTVGLFPVGSDYDKGTKSIFVLVLIDTDFHFSGVNTYRIATEAPHLYLLRENPPLGAQTADTPILPPWDPPPPVAPQPMTEHNGHLGPPIPAEPRTSQWVLGIRASQLQPRHS